MWVAGYGGEKTALAPHGARGGDGDRAEALRRWRGALVAGNGLGRPVMAAKVHSRRQGPAHGPRALAGGNAREREGKSPCGPARARRGSRPAGRAGTRPAPDIQAGGRGADRGQGARLAQPQAHGAVGGHPRHLRLSDARRAEPGGGRHRRGPRRAAADLERQARDGEPGAAEDRGRARLCRARSGCARATTRPAGGDISTTSCPSRRRCERSSITRPCPGRRRRSSWPIWQSGRASALARSRSRS